MGYGGHVQDSINRMKQNRELNRARRERREKLMEAMLKKSKISESSTKHEKPLSDEDREDLIHQLRKERRKQIALQIVAALLAVGTLLAVG